LIENEEKRAQPGFAMNFGFALIELLIGFRPIRLELGDAK